MGITAVSVATIAAIAYTGLHIEKMRALDDAARATKTSVSALRDLNAAGAAVGIDATQMNSEMTEFAKKLREAQQAGGDLADFLEANNIAIKNADGNLRPMQQVFGEIVALVRNAGNETDKLAALTKLGFSADLLRLIERNNDAVQKFANSTVALQEETNAKLMVKYESLSGAWHRTTTAMGDAMTEASYSILSTVGDIEHKAAAMFSELASRIRKTLADITGDVQSSAKSAKDIFETQRSELMRQQRQDIIDGKAPYGDLSGNTFGSKAAPKPKSDAPTIQGLYEKDDEDKKKAKGDNSGARLAQEEARDEVAAAKSAYELERSLIDEKAKLHILSAEEQVSETKKAVDAEYAAMKAAYDKEMQAEGLKPERKKAILAQLAQLERDHAKEMQRLYFQQVEDQVKNWSRMVDVMSFSLSSGISGMIEGTQNFRQVLSSVARGVEREFVKMGVNLVADWAKKQIAMLVLSQTVEGQKTAAAVAGSSARTGVSAAEAATSSATIIASVLRSITASAAEAFAGVFGFLAPIMGPAAVGPAAAAQATVMSIPMYDIGAWSIDKDQLAMVHRGEMVMTAGQSEGLRNVINAASGNQGAPAPSAAGDTHVHLNVSAMDASSVKNWLSGNSRVVMKALNDAVKNGDHLGLRRLAVT